MAHCPSGGVGEAAALAARYGYPTWMVERFMEFAPDPAGMLAELERPPRHYLRVNTLCTTEEALRAVLEARGFRLAPTWLPGGLEVTHEPHSIGATSEYLRGHYYLQDLASQVPAAALAPAPGEIIVDCCAAPGGKTTQLAALMGNLGLLVALEAQAHRLASLTANLQRLGVADCAVVHADARRIGEFGLRPDAILLDAPCTGEGVIGRDPTRKTSRGPGDIAECSATQRELLDAALTALAPGGRLAYSTCSFAPEENEAVVDAALKAHDVNLMELRWGEPGLTGFRGQEYNAQLKKARRFYPHLHGTQGFFVALFAKEGP